MSDIEKELSEEFKENPDNKFLAIHFMSLHYFFGWEETTTTRAKVSVVMNLLSGTLDSYGCFVVEDGIVLRLKVWYPTPMLNVR